MKKFHWIDETIKIDFKLSEDIKSLMREAEKLDLADNPAYFNYAEAIEDSLKEYVLDGDITEKQWRLVCKKYGGW